MYKTVTLVGLGSVLALTACGIPDGGDSDVVAVQSKVTGCVPGASQISIFQGSVVGLGECRTLNPGFYPTGTTFGLPNDSIQSVSVGQSARAVLFRDDHYFGPRTILTMNTGGLVPNTSSIRVERNSDNCQSSTYAPGTGAVAIYDFPNYDGTAYDPNTGRGDCTVVHNDDVCIWVPSGAGRFANPDQCFGLRNDLISSAKIGPNTTGIFHRDANFTGIVQVLHTSQPDFGTLSIGDNTVSSIEVTSP